jgi:hypothetical protein
MIGPVFQPINFELSLPMVRLQGGMLAMHNEKLTLPLSTSLGAQQLLGPGFFYSINHAVGFMQVANVLGEREA